MSRTHQIAMLRREEAVPGTLTRTERYAESGDAICTLEPRFESEVLVAQASDFFDALVQLRTQLEKQDLLIRVNGASKIDIFAAEPDLAPSSIVEQERYRDEWFSSLGRET